MAYPERPVVKEAWHEAITRNLVGELAHPFRSRWHRYHAIVAAVNAHTAAVTRLSDQAITTQAQELGQRMRREGFTEPLVAHTFALVREAANRRLGLRHYDVQLIGGRILLQGMVAEMETGEGKTLVATLPAATAALAGVPVHVITANDYLTSRDAEWMGPVYQALGLEVGTVCQGMSAPQRKAAYGHPVTYCTNKEITFDFLRDRLLLGTRRRHLRLRVERLFGEALPLAGLVLRGLHFAIVDEADSVMVDEARTPLIISGQGEGGCRDPLYGQALAVAQGLVSGRDFRVHARERRAELTDSGRARLAETTCDFPGVWRGPRRAEELVSLALAAERLYQRDVHYLVREGKVQIVDEYTGRVLPDRAWENGLHQMIEAKEGLDPTHRREPLARTSYQHFFRRYLRLAGMTGTAREVSQELRRVYRLEVVRVPTNRKLRRSSQAPRIFSTAEQKWQAVLERVCTLHEQGRPVLIGTRSVSASEHLGRLLTAEGVPHQVLNARQDEAEAEIIAAAGMRGAVTVATNMAGRGTDIRLGPDVVEAGGLRVLATELHDARRIDRQLFGRCGRQGDPGEYQLMASLEDELVEVYAPNWLVRPMKRISNFPGASLLARLLLRWVQRRAEHYHAQIRRDLLTLDERREESLAFSGRREG